MTKRRYFTCPIQAAYMVKEFKVKFESEKRTNLELDIDYNSIWWDYKTGKGNLQCFQGKKFYVTKESEEIFEALERDKPFFTGELENE